MSRLPKSERALTRARVLRKAMSDEERILWMLLRDRRLASYKFRKQVPLGDYVADFVCYDSRLIVELDGSQHTEPKQQARDAQRDAYFQAAGFHVLRITTGDLFKERDGVLEMLLNALEGRH